MKTRSPRVLQAEYDADKKIFDKYGASREADGKILLCIRLDNEVDGGIAYFFDAEQKKHRIHTSTFRRLLNEGKAVRVAPDAFKK